MNQPNNPERFWRALYQAFSARPLAWYMVAAFIFLYLNLFILPHTPIYLAEDAQVYLANAARMLDGQRIYKDFFQFTTPGTEFVYWALFRIFGARAWIPNSVLLLLGLGLAWVGVAISRKVLSGWPVFLPSLAFLTFAFRIWFIGGTHSWYSVLAAMLAVLAVIDHRTPARLAGAGALCGLASFFTQTRGVAAAGALLLFLLWERRRRGQTWRSLLHGGLYLVVSFLLVFAAVNLYFVRAAGLSRFLDCTVLFPIRYFSADSMYNTMRVYMTDLPEILSSDSWMTYRLPALATWTLAHGLFPFVYVAFFMRYRRESPSLRRGVRPLPEIELWSPLMLVSLMGSAIFLGIAPSPSWFRLASVSLPALIILVWLVGPIGSPRKFGRAVLWTLTAGSLILAIAEPAERQLDWRAPLVAPPGRMAILDPDLYDKFTWLLRRTQNADYFFRGIYPDYYFPLGLRNPARAPFITATDYTRPEQVQDVLESLENHHVRFVLWSVYLDVPGNYRPEGDHLGPLRTYLRRHYHVVKVFPDADFEQVWERDDSRLEPEIGPPKP